jgi:YegS/Rv2252/BmrU family lipid kinase
MTSVAVIAHARKRLGDGLPALRRQLAEQGFDDPIWHEVQKSKQVPKRIRGAVAKGADLIFVWGGDGTVQRAVDALIREDAARDVTLAILPAGTANLLASNLGIPVELVAAVEAGLHGDRRVLDAGRANGEHFAVMAGCGFDARMIGATDRHLKDRFGRAAYLWTGARSLRAHAVPARVRVDGEDWFRGDLSCLLVGNVGSLFANVTVFDHARPDDGRLDVGVVTAKGVTAWARAFARVAVGTPDRSPFVRTTVARRIDVRLDRPLPYELDGGARTTTKKLTIKVRPRALRIAVPAGTP